VILIDNESELSGLASRLSDVFRDERCFYRLLLAAGGVIAVLKGLRLPYIWAATQAQIDYRSGYLRRGLFGEVCRRLHIPTWHYSVFCAVAFGLLAGFFWLLARSVRRSGLDAAGLGAFTALLASSFCITMLTNLVGYYDILMALLVLGVMQFKSPRVQVIAALVAGIVGVMVHELYAIAYLPVSLAGVVYALTGEERRQKMLWVGLAAALVIPWTMVLVPMGHAKMVPADIAQLAAAIRARVDFPSHDGVIFEIFAYSSSGALHRMLGYMHAGTYWVLEGFGLLAFLPTTLFFLGLAWRIASARRRALRWYFVLCTLTPLLLNLVAYDRFRWFAMMELNAALCAIAACWSNSRLQSTRADTSAQPVFGVAWRRAAIFLLAINLATDIGLFQGDARHFPFQSYWTDYQEAKRAHRPVFQPPAI
jgi:hypothetical protein